jgi:hypothetical protein
VKLPAGTDPRRGGAEHERRDYIAARRPRGAGDDHLRKRRPPAPRGGRAGTARRHVASRAASPARGRD